MNQRTILWLTGLVIVLLTFVPGSLLALLGWNYGGFGGNPLTKIHPASYVTLAVCGFLMLFRWNEKDLSGGRVHFIPLPVLTYMLCILAILAFLTLFHGGGSIAFMLDSLLMPGLVIILLQHLTPQQQATLFRMLIGMFVLNVAIGIAESLGGQRLIPFTVQGVEIIYDRRPTALMGHPLSNAHLTAIAIFFAIGCLHSKMAKVLIGGFFAVGLVVFGGRSSMVLGALMYLIYLAALLMRKANARQLQWSDLALVSGGLVLTPIVIVVIFAFTPFGQNMLERLTWDDSAQSRIGLFGIFGYLDTLDLLIGIPLERFKTYLILLDMPWTIENAWIQLLVRFGVIFFMIFLFGLYKLFRYLARGQNMEGLCAFVLFLLIASTNNSLSGKGSLLSVFAVLAITGKAYRMTRASVLPPAPFPAYTVQPA